MKILYIYIYKETLIGIRDAFNEEENTEQLKDFFNEYARIEGNAFSRNIDRKEFTIEELYQNWPPSMMDARARTDIAIQRKAIEENLGFGDFLKVMVATRERQRVEDTESGAPVRVPSMRFIDQNRNR